MARVGGRSVVVWLVAPVAGWWGVVSPASAAVGTTYIVNSTAEPGDGICEETTCTLREAIEGRCRR